MFFGKNWSQISSSLLFPFPDYGAFFGWDLHFCACRFLGVIYAPEMELLVSRICFLQIILASFIGVAC